MADSSSHEQKLSYLVDLLKEASKVNNGASYELGIAELLRNNWEGMKAAFAQLCLYDIGHDERSMKLFAAGGILRKNSREITEEDFMKLDNPMKNIVQHSCADAIIETLKLYS